MKLVPVLFMLTAALVSGADRAEFDRVVDFSATLEDLDEIVRGERPFDPEKLVIVEGAVESITVVNREEESFLAFAELVKGRWIGLEEIGVTTCYVQFAGPEFSGRLSSRPAEDGSTVSLNSRVLVVGNLGVLEAEDGNPIPVVIAIYARVL